MKKIKYCQGIDNANDAADFSVHANGSSMHISIDGSGINIDIAYCTDGYIPSWSEQITHDKFISGLKKYISKRNAKKIEQYINIIGC